MAKLGVVMIHENLLPMKLGVWAQLFHKLLKFVLCWDSGSFEQV